MSKSTIAPAPANAPIEKKEISISYTPTIITIHDFYMCDGCSGSPIEGTRWNKSGTDYCQDCYDEKRKEGKDVSVFIPIKGREKVIISPKDIPNLFLEPSSKSKIISIICDGCGDNITDKEKWECKYDKCSSDFCSTCFKEERHFKSHLPYLRRNEAKMDIE